MSRTTRTRRCWEMVALMSPSLMAITLADHSTGAVDSWPPVEPYLSFYDDLRSSPPTGARVQLSHDSPVVQVSLSESDGDEGVSVGEEALEGVNANMSNRTPMTMTTYRLVHLEYMEPFIKPNGEFDPKSLDMFAAAYMAVLDFNRRSDSVVRNLGYDDVIFEEDWSLKECNVRLTMKSTDTELSPTVAVRKLLQEVIPKKHGLETPMPAGIVGALRSDVSMPLSIMAGLHKIPSLSFASLSNTLDNKDVYPYFGRVGQSGKDAIGAAVSYLRHAHNVTHVGVLHSKDGFGSALNAAFTQAAFLLDPPMKVVSASYEDFVGPSSIETAIQQLLDTNFNYFFAAFSATTELEVYEIGSRMGLMGPGKFWLAEKLFIGNGKFSEQTARGLTGVRIVSPHPPVHERFEEEWYQMKQSEDFQSYLGSQLPSGLKPHNVRFRDKPSHREQFAYDTVMSFGIAACQSEPNFFDGESLRKSIRKLSFRGASGDVRFDTNTGARASETVPFLVSAVVPDNVNSDNLTSFTFVDVAHTDGVRIATDGTPAKVGRWRSISDAPYAGGSLSAPLVLPPQEELVNLINPSAIALGLSLALATMILSVLAAVWIAWNRQHPIVKYAKPSVLFMVSGGTFVMSTSIIPMAAQEHIVGAMTVNTDALRIACISIPWLFQMGFAITASALVSKSLRMNDMFRPIRGVRHIDEDRVKIMLPFLCIVGFSLALLLWWTIFSTPSWNRIFVGSVDGFGRPNVSYGTCTHSSARSAFVAVFAVVDVAILAIGLSQAYVSRHIPSQYNEGFYVMISLICALQTFLIGSIALMPLSGSPTALFLTRSIMIALFCWVIIIPSFAPKVATQKRRRPRRRTTLEMSRRPIQMTWSEVIRFDLRGKSSTREKAVDSSFFYRADPTDSEKAGQESKRDASSEEGNEPWAPGLSGLAL